MATITAQVTNNEDGSKTALWETLTATNNVGSLVTLPGYKLESVQMIGTFGGAVTMHGTNDSAGAATVVPLKDSTGTAISTTAAAGFGVSGQMRHVQPKAAAGVSDVDVYAHFVAES